MRSLSLNPFVRDSWRRWLALTATALAALLCLWAAVHLLWTLLDRSSPVSTPNMADRVITDAAAPMEIAQWHLFGNGQQVRLKEAIRTARRETELKLVLHGTVARTEADSGYAMIADEHGVERSYKVGDALPDGAKLSAVYADHVLIDNHGSSETLSLPRDTLDAARRAASAPPQTALASAATPLYVAPRMAYGKVDWQQARAEMAADPARALQQLDIQPVFNGSQMRGVRLGSNASNPLVAAAGLQADDVVTAVNGVPLDSLARGRQLFEQLEGASSIDLTILRDGRPQTLSVDLDRLR